MVTATQAALIDPLGRTSCWHRHPWSLETRRIDRAGVWHCTICSQHSREGHIRRKKQGLYHRTAERDTPAPKPGGESERARWRTVQLAPSVTHLRGEAAVTAVVVAFYMRMLHMPTVIIVHPEQMCKYGEVTIRDARDMEPLPADAMTFYAR